MNVLSLFDGMSCGQIALNRAGIKYDNYFASEIDKYAIKVTQANFPNTIQLGSVTEVFAKDLPQIDLIIGGSPCQGFSFAGKGLNFNDPRSKLFFEFVRLVKECKPKYFLLENVQMKREHEIVISRYLGVNPIEINSALVSAQNRVRLYWTNIYNEPFGLFGDMECKIPQPQDKGILLKDILETEVDEKYFISNKALDRVMRTGWSNPQFNPEKTGSLLPKNNSGQLSVDSGTTLIINNHGQVKPNQNKSGCFTAGVTSGGNHSDMDLVMCVAQRGRNPETPTGNNPIYTKNYLQLNDNGHKSQGERAYYEDSKNGSLGTGHSMSQPKVLLAENKIRRLTEIECERLQTVPDNYTNHVSSTQRYKMLGNGWTIDVVTHILKHIK